MCFMFCTEREVAEEGLSVLGMCSTSRSLSRNMVSSSLSQMFLRSLLMLGVGLISMRKEVGEEEAEDGGVEVDPMEMFGGGRMRGGREGKEEEEEERGDGEGIAVMQVMGESAMVMLAEMRDWVDGCRLMRETLPPSLSLIHTHRQLCSPGSTGSPSAAQVSW